jgi:hypothetical protein
LVEAFYFVLSASPLLHFNLKAVAGPTKTVLYPASNSAE